MKKIRAEVIAIGDEMTSGQRLDTNTQWISQQLGDLGVEVAFHSTVGDTLADNLRVFDAAGKRADLVVMTGGLGPTADDLTREALAKTAGLELEFHKPTLIFIRSLYAKFNREMPEQNRVQAYFPAGSDIIPNPEGTAPGIDLKWKTSETHSTRFFCLPGVPAEMKQMWTTYVADQIKQMTGIDTLIHHHVLHCFGTGESSVEKMLGDLTKRGRDPRVGITASRATISLRVTTQGADIQQCIQKMEPTISTVRERLGEMVFGQNGETLAESVLNLLVEKEVTLSISDHGLGGAVCWALYESVHLRDNLMERISHLKGATTGTAPPSSLTELAKTTRGQFASDYSIAIGQIEKHSDIETFRVVISDGQNNWTESFNYAGHSDFRHVRSVKQVLNFLRLILVTS